MCPLHALLRRDLRRPADRVQGPGQHTQVITFPDEPFASYFSGNTVQICPVGALTAKPYRFRARPWDLEAVESVSPVDSVGSKVSRAVEPERDRQDQRSRQRRHQPRLAVGQGPLRLPVPPLGERVTEPLIRDGDGFRTASWGEALDLVSEQLSALIGAEIAGLGGARNTNEEALRSGSSSGPRSSPHTSMPNSATGSTTN